MFHQRRQGPDESVDEYAQELRKLFYKAYPPTYHGTPEAELLGKSVLSNQFVAGLEPGLHKKLTGVEGNFEELVCKARFEEAKWKETNAGRRKSQGDKKVPKKSGEESEEKPKRKRGYQQGWGEVHTKVVKYKYKYMNFFSSTSTSTCMIAV